ncbi:MAG: hypothetical protein CVU65_16920 [Deltaproteobacteria bacterium HGW-Deltaproteobacteria-22]|nr:MAG: hypothetical protein CVU65_16920 [Deltaproteobacteria bacterium HGW-Deltaproteobacteria-22]
MSKRPAAELKAAPVNRIDVIIRESGIELHETASSLRGKGVASDRPVYFIGRAIDPAQEPKYLKPKAEHLPDEGHLASEVCIIPDGDPPAKDGRLAGLKGAQKTAAFLLMECRCQIQVRLVFNRLF